MPVTYFCSWFVEGIGHVHEDVFLLHHVQDIFQCDVLAVPAYGAGGAPVYQLADVKVFGIEGASGHDVVAVPACEVEGVPEHDVLLDRECICQWTVVVAAMRQGDFDTRCTAVLEYNYKHLEIQIETVNDTHGSEDS